MLTDKKIIDPEELDTSVSPADNFFEFVNGKWIKSNPIPDDHVRWGSFVVLAEETTERLRKLFEELREQNPKKGDHRQQIRDFYLSGMNEGVRDELGLSVLDDFFKKIDSLSDVSDVPNILSYFHERGIFPLWGMGISQDMKDAEKYALYISQGGIGLPDRDYYMKSGDYFETAREKYKKYGATLLSLAGSSADEARRAFEAVYHIEKTLAEHSMTRVERRDPDAQYNPMTLEELEKLSPRSGMRQYFGNFGVDNLDKYIVMQPQFFKAVHMLLSSVPLEDWKIYFRWTLVNSLAPLLTGELEEAKFNFYGKFLGGARRMKPLWRRVVMQASGVLHEQTGKLYIEHYFSEEAKERVHIMMDDIAAAYRERIEALTWMSDETKKNALEKLDKIVRKLGFPDEWRDYSSLEIAPDRYLQNFVRAAIFEFHYDLEKLDKPVDRKEWFMSPATINAYYNPSMNEIVFPAGILQPPFFDKDADDAVNYGAIGGVIGHELTHGFDDKGSKFDEVGNLRMWWTEADRKRFENRAKILVNQFNEYEPFEGMRINGKLTLGENIADLGGLSIAYDALMRSFDRKGRPEDIDGLTSEQRFFIAWAIAWRLHTRDELAKQRLVTDPHSPPKYRVNGPVSNLEEFYEAFGVEEGDELYRPSRGRAKIW